MEHSKVSGFVVGYGAVGLYNARYALRFYSSLFQLNILHTVSTRTHVGSFYTQTRLAPFTFELKTRRRTGRKSSKYCTNCQKLFIKVAKVRISNDCPYKMYLKQIILFLSFKTGHLWLITHKNLVNYTTTGGLKSKEQSALWFHWWTDAWWEMMAACTAKGGGKGGLIRDQNGQRDSKSLSLCWSKSVFYTQYSLQQQAFNFLEMSWHYSEISGTVGVYSARGLLGVICLLACSSSWSVVRKALTLSAIRENLD